MKKTYIVLCQNWEETRANWGSRPCGFTYHLDEVSRKQYISKYLSSLHEGENPIGKPYPVVVDHRIYNNLKEGTYNSLVGVGWVGPQEASAKEIDAADVKLVIKKSSKSQKSRFLVLCQQWTENERGWGTRPDGFTMHLTQEDRDNFIKDYNKKHNNLPSAPDEYTSANGDAYFIIIDKSKYDILNEKGGSMWGDSNYAPAEVSAKEMLEFTNKK